MKNLKKVIKNAAGGTLLITIVILSLMIVILMAGATLKLAEVARQAARVNEQMRFHNAMEDLSQTVLRAVTFNAAQCPPNTGAYTFSGTITGCVPDRGITQEDNVSGICVDLDQNIATTHDQYCISGFQQITAQVDPKDLSNVALKEEPPSKLMQFLNAIFIPIADATCQWYTCTNPAPTGGAGDGDVSGFSVTYPPMYSGPPATAATEMTASDTAVARNNKEVFSPNIATWADRNEIMTPTCNINVNEAHATQSQFWIGCIRCNTQGIRCLRIKVCPPQQAGCSNANAYFQVLAFWD